MNALGHIVDGGSGRVLSPKAEKLMRYLMDHPNTIHKRADLSVSIDCPAEGRSIDTYASEIRKSLGPLNDRIVSATGAGYGWIGDPVALVPVVKEHVKPVRNNEMNRFAVMSQADVAKRLGISTQAVSAIETAALKKLRSKPDLKDAWLDLLTHKKRAAFDPFHEIWLFSVQEAIPKFGVAECEPSAV